MRDVTKRRFCVFSVSGQITRIFMPLRRYLQVLLASMCALFLLGGCGDKSTAIPVIASLSPSSVQAGSVAFTLTVNGTGFASDAKAQWNGSERATTVVSATQITTSISAQDVATSGSAQVTVSSGGKTSAASPLTISAPLNPVPAISSLSPTTAVAGSAAFTLTVNGTGFVAGSTVQWNGAARTTTFVNTTQLTAAVAAADIATAGTASVTVVSPAPGGGTSAAATFTISPASSVAPALVSLSPATSVAGGRAFTLTVTGSGFQSGAAVAWNGTARPTTFVSATQLTAAIPASDVASAGTATVDVVQGGIRSASQLRFTIQVPVPALTTLSPNTAVAGGAAFTLTVTGTNFLTGATVLWNGSARPTAFVSATQLTAAIPASDIASAGAVAVDVVQSNVHAVATLPFTVSRVTAPIIVSFDPASVFAGAGAFSLKVNGTGFTTNSVVSWNGTRLTTTFVSGTQLTAAVTSALDGSATAASIVVTNPSEEGGASSAATFSVNAPPSGKIVQLLSKNYSNGNPSAGTWDWSSVSRDGRYVGYQAYASDLVAADTNGEGDGFVTDTCVGAPGGCTPSTQRVSVDSTGAQYPYGGAHDYVYLSGDGRYALYDREIQGGVEIRDTCAGATGCARSTIIVYSDPPVGQSDGVTVCCSRYSRDGRFVLSSRQIILPNSTAGNALYVTDTCIGAPAGCTTFTQRVAQGLTATPPRQSFTEDISNGGRYILFHTNANLIDPTLSTEMHVFLEDTCIGAPAGCTPTYSMIDVRPDGTESAGNGPNDAIADAESSFSADGRYISFAATATDLIAGRTLGTISQVYLRDTCIGAPAGCTPSTILVSENEAAGGIRAYKGSRAVSEHGRYVTYLRVPYGSAYTSVMVRDTCIGAPAGCVPSTSNASLDPDSVNPATGHTSYLFPSISADGHYVTFTGSSDITYRIQQVFLALTGY